MDTGTERSYENKTETIATWVLSIAAFAITWCGYQGALWNKMETFHQQDAGRAERDAMERTFSIEQRRQIDIEGVMNFVNAVVEKKEASVNFYLAHSRPELSAIMVDWMEEIKHHRAHNNPLSTQAYKNLMATAMAVPDSLRRVAKEFEKKANKANKNANNYVLCTVVFSMVLFLGGVGGKSRKSSTGIILVTGAGIICLIAILLLFIAMPLAQV